MGFQSIEFQAGKAQGIANSSFLFYEKKHLGIIAKLSIKIKSQEIRKTIFTLLENKKQKAHKHSEKKKRHTLHNKTKQS